VSFAQASYTVNEDGDLEIEIIVSNPSTNPIDVQILGIQPPSQIRIPAEATSAVYVFPFNDDNVCEDDEVITLTIDASSLPDGCVVGNPGTTMVTIVDDDSE